jgi:hypothetical protein
MQAGLAPLYCIQPCWQGLFARQRSSGNGRLPTNSSAKEARAACFPAQRTFPANDVMPLKTKSIKTCTKLRTSGQNYLHSLTA